MLLLMLVTSMAISPAFSAPKTSLADFNTRALASSVYETTFTRRKGVYSARQVNYRTHQPESQKAPIPYTTGKDVNIGK